MAADDRPKEPTSQPKPADAFDELKRRRADESSSRQLYAMSGMGLEFIAEVGGMAFIGWWLDRTFVTSPWLTLAGVAVGFTLGLYRLIRSAQRTMK